MRDAANVWRCTCWNAGGSRSHHITCPLWVRAWTLLHVGTPR